MKWSLLIVLFIPLTSALRIEIGIDKKDLFCFAFVMPVEVELPRFQYFERQLKKCDGYGLYSVKDIPEHNIKKVLDISESGGEGAFHAAHYFHRNYMNGVATWNEVVKQAANYRWFFNVHTDTFFRPTKVMSAIRSAVKGMPASGIVAVSRPGRHSNLEVSSCAVALSSELLQKMIANPVADPAKLAAHNGQIPEDRLLNVWIKSVNGTILNTVNNDANSCTSFSSTDRQDLPQETDLQKMLAGASYTKRSESDAKSGSAIPKGFEICYSSDLAAIHPVKDDSTFKKLCDQLH